MTAAHYSGASVLASIAGGKAVFQKPPTGQNWAIGGRGDISGDGPFDGPEGFLEQNGNGLLPHSLYIAQLCERFWDDRLIAEAVGLPASPRP